MHRRGRLPPTTDYQISLSINNTMFSNNTVYEMPCRREPRRESRKKSAEILFQMSSNSAYGYIYLPKDSLLICCHTGGNRDDVSGIRAQTKWIGDGRLKWYATTTTLHTVLPTAPILPPSRSNSIDRFVLCNNMYKQPYVLYSKCIAAAFWLPWTERRCARWRWVMVKWGRMVQNRTYAHRTHLISISMGVYACDASKQQRRCVRLPWIDRTIGNTPGKDTRTECTCKHTKNRTEYSSLEIEENRLIQ